MMIYLPQTATPFRQNEEYAEILPRNPELARYIRCFWGSCHPYVTKEKNSAPDLVIPDTCADIIYNVDHTAGTVSSCFCGLNDSSFVSSPDRLHGHLISAFGIRFFAWGIYAFSEDTLKDTLNGFYDVRTRFRWLDSLLPQQLFETTSLIERARTAETLFTHRLFEARRSSVIDNAIGQILLKKGALDTVQLAREAFVSGRQLERIFHEYIGITPKKLINLMRYQFLWNDILTNPNFNVQDSVYQYCYTDQSHLMREFKRYHTMSIQTARSHAFREINGAVLQTSRILSAPPLAPGHFRNPSAMDAAPS